MSAKATLNLRRRSRKRSLIQFLLRISRAKEYPERQLLKERVESRQEILRPRESLLVEIGKLEKQRAELRAEQVHGA